MELARPLIEGSFLERRNRFAATVRVAGDEITAHVPNSGRMRELLVPGAQVLLTHHAGSHRKTAYDLTLVRYKGHWVGVDSRWPNRLFAAAVQEGSLSEFRAYRQIQREVRWHDSRIDFLLSGDAGRCLVETKSVNLVEDGIALFPDAPTTRGARHVEDLRLALDAGYQAAVVFLVQRPDACRLMSHDEADPAFGEALRAAAAAGVRVLAYTCRVTPAAITVAHRIPVAGLPGSAAADP